MVSFVCNACGNTVKKNQVEKHYQTICRNCNILSCIDCGKDFPGDAYANHTTCITEAEKYQGHLYQPKDKGNKGDAKQKQWTSLIQSSASNNKDPKIKSLLEKISEYSNVPRKQKKFENFCKNSVRVYDQATLNKLWSAFSESTKKIISPEQEANGDKTTKINTETKSRKRKMDDDEGTEEKFNWRKTIKQVLQENKEQTLSIKKLQKRVLKAYVEFNLGVEKETKEDMKCLFDKKLAASSKVAVQDGIVSLA